MAPLKIDKSQVSLGLEIGAITLKKNMTETK
jgi:hypothetical protein